jgi:hypothetical protein
MLFEQILAPENLRSAWQHVKERKGAAGIDGTEIAMYLQWINPRWDNIKRGLEQGYYCPPKNTKKAQKRGQHKKAKKGSAKKQKRGQKKAKKGVRALLWVIIYIKGLC